MTPRIAVVDYGMGNRRSAEKALARVGARAVISEDHDELRRADGLLLPGVGAFPAAMDALRARGLDSLLAELTGSGAPLFGACLGMQLLFDRSEEHGGAEGLGLLGGEVTALRAPGRKLPHIGWSAVTWRERTAAPRPPDRTADDAPDELGSQAAAGDSPLRAGLPQPTFLYHVHSFIVRPADPAVVLAVAEYGETFTAVVGAGHIYGAQSHPEKSSTHGLRLLANFVTICAQRAGSSIGTGAS
jgi:imidazole glycerol-phosphate synthase subunit HisH